MGKKEKKSGLIFKQIVPGPTHSYSVVYNAYHQIQVSHIYRPGCHDLALWLSATRLRGIPHISIRASCLATHRAHYNQKEVRTTNRSTHLLLCAAAHRAY